MRKIFSIAILAVAFFTLSSCQKEIENNNPAERIISAEFTDDGTKTTLSATLWLVGDKIRVFGGSSYQDITLVANGSTPGPNEGKISADSQSFTFTTTLEGPLYAVYPASATTMTSCSDGNISFTISSSQDGTFGSANICVASGNDKDNLYFSNATAVVEMTVASDVVYASLSATNTIAGEMTVEMGSSGVINSTDINSFSSNHIFVSGTPSRGKFYMAVLPVETGAVSVTCNTSTKSGFVNKGSKTLEINKIYSMNLSGMTIATEDLTGQFGVLNGQDYVLIKAKYDGTNYSYLKWATQNLAVTASGKAKWNGTNYVIGDYFQWGASYEGYGITEASFKTPTNLVIYDSFINTFTIYGNSFTFKTGKTFSISSAPYSDGSKYTKYLSGNHLELSDDVANIVLGGTWRMPTGGNGGHFSKMCSATYWAWDATDKGYYVFKPGVGTSGAANGTGAIAGTDDKTKALLFFPAAGYGILEDLIMEVYGVGNYWSRTLESPDYAFFLCFASGNVNPWDIKTRRNGKNIRPVSE